MIKKVRGDLAVGFERAFPEVVRLAASGLGLAVTFGADGGCLLHVDYRGRDFLVSLNDLRDGNVVVTVFSGVIFARDRLPQRLLDRIALRNDQLLHFDWRGCTSSQDERLGLVGKIALLDLTAATLRRALGEMLAEADAMDSALESVGYTRSP